MKPYSKGMVFGVFDGLHEGHKHFLREALAQCKELVVVVAADESVLALKGRAPKEPVGKRMDSVSACIPEALVVRGDVDIGSWNVVNLHAPSIVLLGYDQKELGEALGSRAIPYIYLGAHEPERYKSSILNQAKPQGGDGS